MFNDATILVFALAYTFTFTVYVFFFFFHWDFLFLYFILPQRCCSLTLVICSVLFVSILLSAKGQISSVFYLFCLDLDFA
jgi:hypothetical protein